MKAAQSVLEPARVRAMLRHLTPAERADALRGLALLARAATQEMSRAAARHTQKPGRATARASGGST
jgi:hypothetical protein